MQQKQLSEETLLKTAKEVAVKFIEIGRVTPANFDAIFRNIYHTIEEVTVKKTATKQEQDNDNS